MVKLTTCLALLFATLGSCSDMTADILGLTNEAIELAEAGMFTEALELFQEAVDKDPLVGTSWENLGVISMRMGLHEKAKFSLIKAKSILGDSSASVKINLAALKEHLGSTDDLDDGSGYEAEEIIDPALAGQLTSEAISKAENGDEEVRLIL